MPPDTLPRRLESGDYSSHIIEGLFASLFTKKIGPDKSVSTQTIASATSVASTACNTDVDLSSPTTLLGEASDSAAYNDIEACASREGRTSTCLRTVINMPSNCHHSSRLSPP